MIFYYWAGRKNGILISSFFVFHDRDDYRDDRTADDVINTGATLLHSVGYSLCPLFIKVIPPNAVGLFSMRDQQMQRDYKSFKE